jgi:hypothetical protein
VATTRFQGRHLDLQEKQMTRSRPVWSRYSIKDENAGIMGVGLAPRRRPRPNAFEFVRGSDGAADYLRDFVSIRGVSDCRDADNRRRESDVSAKFRIGRCSDSHSHEYHVRRFHQFDLLRQECRHSPRSEFKHSLFRDELVFFGQKLVVVMTRCTPKRQATPSHAFVERTTETNPK